MPRPTEHQLFGMGTYPASNNYGMTTGGTPMTRKTPILLRPGLLSGRIMALTRYTVKQSPNGTEYIRVDTEHDVTDEFWNLAEYLGLHRSDTVQAARDYMKASRELDAHLAECKACSEGGLCDEGKSISNRIDSAMAAFIESDGGGEAHDPAQ